MGWFKKSRNEELKNVPESVKRQYRCAFTGHRPEKVIGSEGRIIVELRREIEKAIADGYKVFLTGMSRGVDYLEYFTVFNSVLLLNPLQFPSEARIADRSIVSIDRYQEAPVKKLPQRVLTFVWDRFCLHIADGAHFDSDAHVLAEGDLAGMAS